MGSYVVLEQSSGATITAPDYRAAVDRIARAAGIDGAVIVHGTYAVAYHTAAQHSRCAGHLVARVHAVATECPNCWHAPHTGQCTRAIGLSRCPCVN